MAVGDYIARRHAAAQTNVSHTVASKQSFDTAVVSAGTAFSWDSGNSRVAVDEAGLVFAAWSTQTRSSGVQRSHGPTTFRVTGAGARAREAGGYGYCRASGGADEMAMQTLMMRELLDTDYFEGWRGDTSVGSGTMDAVGDYDTTAGDSIGVSAVLLDDSTDWLEVTAAASTSLGILDNTSLNSPYALTDGTWTALSYGTTNDSNGTNITNTTSDEIRAQNLSGRLLLLQGQLLLPR